MILFASVTMQVCVVFMYVLWACACFLHVNLMEVMVSLCLSGQILTIWLWLAHFFYTGTPKWLNNTSYGKQSIFGSGIHCVSKPQIAPIKVLVWHAHTNTELFDLIWLVSVRGHSFSFPNTPQFSPVCSQSPYFIGRCVCVRALKRVCMPLIHVHVSAQFPVFWQ